MCRLFPSSFFYGQGFGPARRHEVVALFGHGFLTKSLWHLAGRFMKFLKGFRGGSTERVYKKETVFVLAFRQRTDEKPSAKTSNNQKDEKKGTGVREPLNRIEQICRTRGGPGASFFGLDQAIV